MRLHYPCHHDPTSMTHDPSYINIQSLPLSMQFSFGHTMTVESPGCIEHLIPLGHQ